MYFLNGERIYINPKNVCGPLDEQLQNCLQQLSEINSGKRIYKINFFVDTITREDYLQIQQKIRNEVDKQIHNEILLSVIAQPPLTCKIIAEVSFYDSMQWRTTFYADNGNGAVLFENGDCRILMGNVQSMSSGNCNLNSAQSFSNLRDIFNKFRFSVSSIVRQWNYLEDILGFDGQEQRYQEFNNARTNFYGNAFEKNGYPAATGIGMKQGGIIIEFVAINSNACKSVPINNPSQIAAHSYSEKVLEGEGCVLKTTPKFERARYLELHHKKLIFISGTASIVGEKTVGVGDPAEQTEFTISNIKQLYSTQVLSNISDKKIIPKYGHARVYLKNRKDFSVIKRTFKSHFGKLPVVYIIADICRKDLLVEIEGKVILE
ncbi:MAG TPA: hypothetical protein VLA03_08305 [Draconibacterium sp.]|nr:hypothetical protein [Draconibacterium sp.]